MNSKKEVKTSNFIWYILIVFLIYFIGFTISLMLSLILHIDLGQMIFNINGHSWAKIFLHNITLIFIIIFSGFLMSIPSVLLIFANGLILGAVVGQSIISNQLSQLTVSMLPYGLPEITAFLVAGGTALHISRHIVKKKFQINKVLFYRVVTCILLTLLASLIESEVLKI